MINVVEVCVSFALVLPLPSFWVNKFNLSAYDTPACIIPPPPPHSIFVVVAAPHDCLARVLDPGEGAVRVDPVPVGDLEELLEHLLRRVAVQTLVDFQIQTETKKGL